MPRLYQPLKVLRDAGSAIVATIATTLFIRLDQPLKILRDAGSDIVAAVTTTLFIRLRPLISREAADVTH